MKMLKRSFLVLGILLGLVGTYFLPPVHQRLAWRLSALQAQVKYALFPPEEAVFIPQQQDITRAEIALLPLPTPTIMTTNVPEQEIVPAVVDQQTTISSQPELTPLPSSVQLTGVRHEYQTWNNCGPANLSMALSFWGWQGSQQDPAMFLKPNPRDKNVMPNELAAYIENQTEFEALVRVGGNLDLLKRFVANGIPVIIEKGFEGDAFDGWMGHYQLVTGYDNELGQLTVQDSYIMPDMPLAYEQVMSFWRAFNFTFIIVFPLERQDEVMALIGPNALEDANFQMAAELALAEVDRLTGRDLFFAWFNRGTNLVAMHDYIGASAAYDEAFAEYASLVESERPWRMMWYQVGPYQAYYFAGRYEDVIDLATTTLGAMSEPILEESYFWRALAREELGDREGAIDDLRVSLIHHPNYETSLQKLAQLEAGP